jgi:23S rRNA pseudouridine1911/1915/1917 synthase
VKPNYYRKPLRRHHHHLRRREGRVVPEEMPLDIRYEDAELLIVNKLVA